MPSDHCDDIYYKILCQKREVDVVLRARDILLDYDNSDEVKNLHDTAKEQIINIREDINIVKNQLERMKSLCEQCKILQDILCDIETQSLDVENSLPDEIFPLVEPVINGNQFTSEPSFPLNVAPQIHSVSKPRDAEHTKEVQCVYSMINNLSEEEFHKVPYYMRGRMSLEEFNNFISGFNKTLKKKYEILKQPKASLKNESKKLYTIFKQQETSETKGLTFCTEDDIKKWSTTKVENKFRYMISILRHTLRVREVRSNGIVRFVVLPNLYP